tara:strand:+ start:262 stop:534 length:273 start_codon:yes stop_codon:yes gene_type:complete
MVRDFASLYGRILVGILADLHRLHRNLDLVVYFGAFFHCSLFLPDIGIITYFLGDEGRPRFFKVLFGTKETFLHSFGSDVDTPRFDRGNA